MLSPGIACDNANVLLAEQRGLEVISEVELGYRLYGGHIAAITGTNGKTTTTLSWVRCSSVCRCLLQ